VCGCGSMCVCGHARTHAHTHMCMQTIYVEDNSGCVQLNLTDICDFSYFIIIVSVI
jgi:hypothetical protein